MTTKREFFAYMSEKFDETYKDEETYILFKTILKTNDKGKLNELHDLTLMSKRDRLIYRYALACEGKELTPKQVDQYLTAIQYALEQRRQ